MAEQRILTHEINRQDNGWFCGPAAVRVALTTQGIYVSEQELAVKLGTTTAGTNSSTDIDRVLDSYINPSINDFDPVFIRGNDVTPAEAAAFKANIVSSIDAEYGCVVNVVGSARDINGALYTYSGGHYVAVCGYRQFGAEMLVTDVAIGRDYWMTANALDTWCAARGYVYASRKPPVQPWVPAEIQPGAPYTLPAGHYYGDINGPAESHGGFVEGEKPTIAAIQLVLIKLGNVPGIVAGTPQAAAWADGIYEQPTIDAVMRFQEAHELVKDGRVGPVTWSALFPVTTPPPPPPPPPVQTDIQLPLATTSTEIVHRAETQFLLDSIVYALSRANGTLDCSWFVAIILGITNPRNENTVTLLGRNHVRPITREQVKPGDLWGKLGPGTEGTNGHVAIIISTPSTRTDGKWEIIHQTSSSSPGPDRVVFNSVPAGYSFYRSSAISDDPVPPPPPPPPGDTAALAAALAQLLEPVLRGAVQEELSSLKTLLGKVRLSVDEE